MNCQQFEEAIQRQADGLWDLAEESAMGMHLSRCRRCQELESGFRMVIQGFAVMEPPRPAATLSDRILRSVAEARAVDRRLPQLVTAVAASLLGAFCLWVFLGKGQPQQLAVAEPASVVDTADQKPLFAELSEAEGGEEMVLVQAVEPLSQLFWVVGRGLGTPVRPISSATSEAWRVLVGQLPDLLWSEMPGLDGIAPPAVRKWPMTASGSSS